MATMIITFPPVLKADINLHQFTKGVISIQTESNSKLNINAPGGSVCDYATILSDAAMPIAAYVCRHFILTYYNY